MKYNKVALEWMKSESASKLQEPMLYTILP